jgi:hypothetical protein
MRGKFGVGAAAMLAALAGMGASIPGSAPGNIAQAIQQGAVTGERGPADRLPGVSTRAEAALRQLFRGSGGPARITYRKRPHLSVRQRARIATKQRNVARNRKAHRG